MSDAHDAHDAHDADDAPSIVVNLDNLLWRTRGRDWDYEFVLRPREPAWGEWYQLYRDVFDGLTPEPESAEPVLRHGYVIAPPQLWVATTFYDAALRDQVGRPILHGLVWFPPARDHPRLPRIPSDWGAQIVRALEAGTARAWGMTRAELVAPQAALSVYAEAAAAQQEVALSGPTIPLVGDGLGVLLKKKPDARLTPSRSGLLFVAAVLVAVLGALLLWLR